jgi:hypothetical protein
MAADHATRGPGGSCRGLTLAGFESRVLAFVGLGIVTLAGALCLPPLPQNQSYPAFADDWTLLGVSNLGACWLLHMVQCRRPIPDAIHAD